MTATQEALAKVGVRTKLAKTNTNAKSAWLENRKTYLGATDVSAILGINPYRSAHDVWLDKMGLTEDVSSIAMRHGTYVETFIASEYSRETGVKIRTSKLYRHPAFPFLACNPDREITLVHNGEKFSGLLECKSVGYWASKNFGQDGSDQIPEHYLMQVMWQLIITRKDFVHLAALVDNRELRIFTYTLKPELSSVAHVFPAESVKAVFNAAINWWNRFIVGETEPLLEGKESDEAWVKQERSTYENGRMTNTDEETDRECVKLKSALVRESRAKEVALMRKNRIRAFMASRQADTLESSVGIFTWKTNVKGVATLKTPFSSQKA